MNICFFLYVSPLADCKRTVLRTKQLYVTCSLAGTVSGKKDVGRAPINLVYARTALLLTVPRRNTGFILLFWSCLYCHPLFGVLGIGLYFFYNHGLDFVIMDFSMYLQIYVCITKHAYSNI